MAFGKKKQADEFRVPSLAEVSEGYAALLTKRADLQERQSKLREERRELERKIRALPEKTHQVSPRIAELLGDEPDSTPLLHKRLAQIRADESDCEAATEIVLRRLTDAKTPASVAVCERVRPEYARRVREIAKALEAVDAARGEYEELRKQLDAEGVDWGSLFPLTLGFLGDLGDGHIQQFMRDNRRAGYVN